MSHPTSLYIHFIQISGSLAIFVLTAYMVKHMRLKAAQRIEKVKVRIEE